MKPDHDLGARAEAGQLKEEYCEDATVYAEVRAEAAATRGAEGSARHWAKVERILEGEQPRSNRD